MNATSALNDDQWSKLLEHVAEAYNEVTLSRGFNYFKQQHVTSLTITEDRIVKARVEGNESYEVTMSLDKLRSSHCTCPVHSSCKHMAAVLMELADRMGYPASHIMNAKHQLKRAAAAPSLGAIQQQLPSMDVPGWHKMMSEFTATIKPAYDQGMYTDMLRVQLQMLKEIPFSDIDRRFWALHQELFILKKVKEQNALGSVNYYTSFALYRIYDDIQASLRTAASSAFNPDLAEERLEQTLAYLREQLAGETGQRYLEFGLYTELWKQWITPNTDTSRWAEQELDAIGHMEVGPFSASLSAAQAFLLMQLGQGRMAWQTLEAAGALKHAQLSVYLPFLSQLQSAGLWEDLTFWLVKTAPSFYGKRTHELDAYTAYWKNVSAHYPPAEQEMWSVLEEMLPHSLRIIEDILYEREQWKPWLEMQIVQGRTPLHHKVSVLQPIEKESPQLLLPYYHQAVEQHVGLKNRQDYKAAVKLLKRLEKIYKKMKKTEAWDRFFQAFAERYSRLRALQEELRKGKLLL